MAQRGGGQAERIENAREKKRDERCEALRAEKGETNGLEGRDTRSLARQRVSY